MAQWFETGPISDGPADFLNQAGEVLRTFSTQDSGNVSYGVRVDGVEFFVKTAGARGDRATLGHAAKVAKLRNAVALRASVSSGLLPRLHQVIESPQRPLLIYDWADGELLRVPAAQRSDPRRPFMRFRSLPAV